MNFLTPTELKQRSDADLVSLYGLILGDLPKARRDSVEWHAAMLSLENIRREQARRRAVRRPTPRGPGF